MKPRSNWVLASLALGFILGGSVGAVAQTADQNGRREAIPPQSSEHPAGTPSQDTPDQVSTAPGVITPPTTGDPNVIQPPSAGPDATPVIKPPGTPGGNPDIQPK